MPIWNSIKRFRETLRMSQRELSELSGRDQAYISRLEAGKINAEIATLTSIAAAVDADLMLVPKSLVPRVRAMIDMESRPAGVTTAAGGLPTSVFDDVFIPDPDDDEDDDDHHAGGPQQ